jgi:hypothetical protein
MTPDLFRDRRKTDLRALPPGIAPWIAPSDDPQDGEEPDASELIARLIDPARTPAPLYASADPARAAQSHAVTRLVLESLVRDGLIEAVPGGPLALDIRNAEDYRFQDLYPRPPRWQTRRLLDFHPGCGRQLNIWCQEVPGLVYTAMESDAAAYIAQAEYFRRANVLPVSDYVAAPRAFSLGEQAGLYHLPTWRFDLLPPGFFDLIMCVDVLPHLSERLLRHMLPLFHRCLATGGGLYIRDDGDAAFDHELDRALSQLGFVLEFRPYLFPGEDIHGLPRLWRKVDPRRPAAGRPVGG